MTKDLIGYISFYDMNIYFFIYAFLGWITEVIYATLKTGKFVNRGFLNGPLCPIYGVGMAFCVLFLNPLSEKWWLLFLVGTLVASGLELLTGFVLDKIFKTKWWDYKNEHFNLKGYICLKFSLLWGIGIVALFYTFVPMTNKLIKVLPTSAGNIVLIILWALFIIDFVATVIQLKKLKRRLRQFDRIADTLHKSSDKLGERLSVATLKVLEQFNKFKNSRLVKAFPRLNKHEKAEKKSNK